MDPATAPSTLAALLRLLDARGWDRTTVDDLAREAGMSRATFFRTFGSKEDVVFADHAAMLARLGDFLDRTGHDTASALREGLLLVFRYHLDDPERTLARHRLLRQSQALRNRELLTSHHYEAVFRRWLRERLAGTAASGDGEGNTEGDGSGVGHDVAPVAAALAGACVALHNSHLRQWLRAPDDRVLEEFSARARRLIHVVLEGYGASPGAAATARPVAVVTVVDPHADTEEIVDAVRRALG
ncbi:TetR family transcriptional regulator [Citricoccus sp. SGAir0253]|uniref:TetR/AcrR family transcriptional regulator n=1 Tax=Citricoccus sp. SGAir0253 TaxID=2567881 RepID=UPI0010CD688F|nr:TetR/AcrR family transcriptional regulator [Citricoccus sp. SGAir0253]QCU78871.1 TetR family transcriptional regulator [Citricoccus sp. SGAir0253]